MSNFRAVRAANAPRPLSAVSTSQSFPAPFEDGDQGRCASRVVVYRQNASGER